MDNGKQFDCIEFRNFYDELGIKLAFASINHPESNRAVKRANGLIFIAISKALYDSTKGKWAQELVTLVWGHNISRTRTTGFTPFRLLYGVGVWPPVPTRQDMGRALKVAQPQD